MSSDPDPAALSQAAMNGLVDGDLAPLSPLLRSFNDASLAALADLIDGTQPSAFRLVMEPTKAGQTLQAEAR